MPVVSWSVRLKGKEIDVVFYTKDCDAEYVRKSLIEHDGYNPNITVHRDKRYKI